MKLFALDDYSGAGDFEILPTRREDIRNFLIQFIQCNAFPLGYLGQIQYLAGDYSQARETLERGIAARGEAEPTIRLGPRWWYLAMALAQLDIETERAKNIYEKLTAELETSSEEVRKNNARNRAELADLLGIQ